MKRFCKCGKELHTFKPGLFARIFNSRECIEAENRQENECLKCTMDETDRKWRSGGLLKDPFIEAMIWARRHPPLFSPREEK